MKKSVCSVFSPALLAVLCLFVFEEAAGTDCGLAKETTLTLTCDSKCRNVYIDGVKVVPDNPRRLGNWKKSNTFILPVGAKVLGIEGMDTDDEVAGILASTDDGWVSDGSWKVSTSEGLDWAGTDFCETATWQAATIVGQNGVQPWSDMTDFADDANWIWTDKFSGETKDTSVYFRKVLGSACPEVAEACAAVPTTKPEPTEPTEPDIDLSSIEALVNAMITDQDTQGATFQATIDAMQVKLDEMSASATKLAEDSENVCSDVEDKLTELGTVPAGYEMKYRVTHMAKDRYTYTLQDARDACASEGKKLATLTQLEAAYRQGYGRCQCGWLDDGAARYVVQWSLDGCGGANVASGLRPCNWQSTWDAYCFL